MKKSFVLIITDKDEPSVSKVVDYLQEMSQSLFRLDVNSFATPQSRMIMSLKNGVVGGYIQCGNGTTISLRDVKSVWFRKPKPISISKHIPSVERRFIEDEFRSSLWSLYTCLDSVFWMNHPLYARNLLEHNKLFQLKLAEASGLVIPDTVITNNPDQLIEFCKNHNGSVAIKTLRSNVFQETDGIATGIYTNRIHTDYLKDHIDDITLAPVMAQEYVPKKLEFRVTIVGENVFTCAIYSQDSERTKDDWRRYDFAKVKHESFNLPQEIKTAYSLLNPARNFHERSSLPELWRAGTKDTLQALRRVKLIS